MDYLRDTTGRIQGKTFLLTYAQCEGLEYETVGLMLSGMGAECLIGREMHEDGGIHYHAYVEFNRQFRSRKMNVFDTDGFHPNIQNVLKTPWLVYDYVMKDGDVVWGGAARPEETRGRPKKEDAKHDWWFDLVHSETTEEFDMIVNTYLAKESVINARQIKEKRDSMFGDRLRTYVHPPYMKFDLSKLPELEEFVEQMRRPRAGKLCLSCLLFYSLQFVECIGIPLMPRHLFMKVYRYSVLRALLYCLLELIGSAGAKGSSNRRCAWLEQFTAPAFGGAPTPPCSALGLKLLCNGS